MAAKAVERLVERMIEGPDGKPHKALVNLGESTVSWLHARKMLDRRQYEAAEVIRSDWERAAMGARVTMNWEMAAAPSHVRRASTGRPDRSLTQIAARDPSMAPSMRQAPGFPTFSGASFAPARRWAPLKRRSAGRPAPASWCWASRWIGSRIFIEFDSAGAWLD